MLATIASDNDEPLRILLVKRTWIPKSVNSVLLACAASLATAGLRAETTTIWELAIIVFPQKGSWLINSKAYLSDFVARFRPYEASLDESRAVLVICHIAKH